MPKQGSGTTNDGITARRFLEDPPLTTIVTGLDEHLIYRFAILLREMIIFFISLFVDFI